MRPGGLEHQAGTGRCSEYRRPITVMKGIVLYRTVIRTTFAGAKSDASVLHANKARS
jgi:hypothetical protein